MRKSNTFSIILFFWVNVYSWCTSEIPREGHPVIIMTQINDLSDCLTVLDVLKEVTEDRGCIGKHWVDFIKDFWASLPLSSRLQIKHLS